MWEFRQVLICRVTGKVPLADSTLPVSALIRTLRRCMLAETSLVGVGCKHEEVVPHCASDIGGCAIAAIPAILQPYFKAGTFPDLACELVLLPGKLIASPFHDRGTASPEFLWRSYIATAVLFGGLAYWALGYRKSYLRQQNGRNILNS